MIFVHSILIYFYNYIDFFSWVIIFSADIAGHSAETAHQLAIGPKYKPTTKCRVLQWGYRLNLQT